MKQKDFDKTVEMMTPKFRPESNFEFGQCGKTCNKRNHGIWWKICSAAAVVALVVAIGLRQPTPVCAETIAKQSLEKLNAVNTYKVTFYLTGIITDNGIKPVPNGNEINGTLYIVNNGGVEMDRIEIESPQEFVEIYDGKTYKRYKNGTLARTAKSPSLGMLNLFSQDNATNFLNDAVITEHGDSIILSHKKGEIVMNGVFSRKSNKLIEAYVCLDHIRMLGTGSIEYGVEVTDKMFE